MTDTERSGSESLPRPAWPLARIALALLGSIALAAGGVGAYISLRPGIDGKPAPQGALGFAVHGAPRELPQFSFLDGQGRARSLTDFRGKTVLLNVWATWCVPCREEMPALDRLQQKLGGPRFEVLALSIDSGGAAAVKRFYDEIGIRALAIHVDSSISAMGALGIVGIPTTLLIDRQGREIGRRTGPAQWDGPEAMGLIASFMAANEKAP